MGGTLKHGTDENLMKVKELREEVQLSRGKISAPGKKLDLDATPPAEEIREGRKVVVDGIVVCNGSGYDILQVNEGKNPPFPALIFRGILERKDSIDRKA